MMKKRAKRACVLSFAIACIIAPRAVAVYDATFPEGVDKPILTPSPSAIPRINGAGTFGVRPGRPFMHKVPATGAKPIVYAARNLPEGLKIDRTTGVISGRAPSQEGTYIVELDVSNDQGRDRRAFRIVVGDTICLTPPMGVEQLVCPFGGGERPEYSQHGGCHSKNRARGSWLELCQH